MTTSAFVILLEILLAIVSLITVVGNILVIEAVCRHTGLRTIPNICITSLAMTDLFVGLFNVPLYIYTVHEDAAGRRISKEYHSALTSLDMFFGAASIAHLAFIGVERCYAMTFPLRRRFLRKATVIKILFGLWLSGTIPVVVFIMKIPSYTAIILGVCFLLPLTIIIISYTTLLTATTISWKKMRNHRVHPFPKNTRLAKTLCMVVTVFVITWTPFFVTLIIFSYFPMDFTSGQLTYLAYFSKIAQYTSSACNPLIYGFRQREFRCAFVRLCGYSMESRVGQRSDCTACDGISQMSSWSWTPRNIIQRISRVIDRSDEQISLHRISVRKKSVENGRNIIEV